MIVQTEFDIEYEQKRRRIENALKIASATAENEENEFKRSWALDQISEALIDLGLYDEAIKVWSKIQKVSIRGCRHELLIYALAYAGRYEQAKELMTMPEVPDSTKDKWMSMVADYMLDRDDRNEVLKLLDIATTPRGRAFVLSAVAESFAEVESNTADETFD